RHAAQRPRWCVPVFPVGGTGQRVSAPWDGASASTTSDTCSPRLTLAGKWSGRSSAESHRSRPLSTANRLRRLGKLEPASGRVESLLRSSFRGGVRSRRGSLGFGIASRRRERYSARHTKANTNRELALAA